MPYLSNVKDINPNIKLNTSNDVLDTTSQKNANYTSNERQGSVNTKAANTNLDTSEYEAKLKDYSDAFNQAQSDLWKAQQMGDWTADMAGAKTRAIRDAQNRMNSAQSGMQQTTTDKSNYLSAQANRTNLDAATTQADQALSSAQQSSQAEAAANKTANINAGINKSKAGMLGSQNATTNTANTANSIFAGNRSAAASTQADYLSKMNQADAADKMADNMSKAANLSAISGALQGAGSGAAMGAVISDENAKQDPIDDSELFDAINEFKQLKAKLDLLKEKRK